MVNQSRMIFALQVLLLLVLSGCSSFGPQTVSRDRFDYNNSISTSWKEQTLLNIVKIRYADMPLFVEVASVIGGYTLESSVDLGGSTGNSLTGDIFNFGTSGKYTDRPTITYKPITGDQFNKSFMTPIPPAAILFLMQSGFSADLIFPLTVEAINGMRAHVAAGSNQRDGDEKYYRVVALMRKLQKTGSVGMRVQKHGAKKESSTVMFFYKKNINKEVQRDLVELQNLLGIKPGGGEVTVNYGLIQKGDNEIAMLTRSMLQIMIDLATQIDVPDEDVKNGWTVPSRTSPTAAASGLEKSINIHSGKEKPDNAFTAVKYDGNWFWIDKGDFKSKRTFTFIMILFSMFETGGKTGLPVVTVSG